MSVSRIHGAGELLASVTTLLGFTPRDSVVVVGLDKRGRLGMMMRVDRSDCLIGEVARELGRSMALQLDRSGMSEAVVISFADDPIASPCAALEALVPHLRARVDVRDAWKVGHGRYRSLWCLDPRCCPQGGTVLPPAPDSVSRLNPLDAGRRSGPQAPPAEQRRRVVRARDRALVGRGIGREEWRVKRLSEWRIGVEEALDGRMPTDAMCGRLLAGLGDVRVRDAVIVDLHGDFADAADALISGETSARVRDALDGLLGAGGAPDEARVEAAVDLALHVGKLLVGRRADPFAAGPYCVAAIGLWWLGDECGSRHCLDAALDADPDYHLARLVIASLAAGLGPRSERG